MAKDNNQNKKGVQKDVGSVDGQPELIHSPDFEGIPTVPLKDMVVYPSTITTIFVGRNISRNAVQMAKGTTHKSLFLVTQRDAKSTGASLRALHKVGVVAKIVQITMLPDKMKVIVDVLHRAKLKRISRESLTDATSSNYLSSDVSLLFDKGDASSASSHRQKIHEGFKRYTAHTPTLSKEVIGKLESIFNFSEFLDHVASHVNLKIAYGQKLLETIDIAKRANLLLKYLDELNDLLEIDREISVITKEAIDKHQKEYFLRQKLKAIQGELHRMNSPYATEGEEVDEVDEISRLNQDLDKLKMPRESRSHIDNEVKRLKHLPSQSQEAGIVRTYIDWFLKLPWRAKKRINKDLGHAIKVLDADHYGLEDIKERIIEHLAIQYRTKKTTGTVLCFVGPPGVGKTSVAKSIARATGRKFVRFALGGVRDEAEIRGHRRTYLAAMPGKIIQNLAKAKCNNPLFLLDEIDKLGNDFRGDPAAALLEVLDPEQNTTFNDHYLEVDYDLSDVMFVCTANSMDIPEALADRLEIINLSGYTEEEKFQIAKNYLWKNQLQRHEVKASEITIGDDSLYEIIRGYTKEAGVRRLNRELEKVVRKSVKDLVLKEKTLPIAIDSALITHYLGIQKFTYGTASKEPQIGHVNGLAWTKFGGELLDIEVVVSKGKGKLQRTGKLGDVMQESIEAAISYIRAHAIEYGLSVDFYDETDIHIHVPEGATPKDGPSAGLAMVIAILSALTQRMVIPHLAMTGEVNLRGEVLAIGGLKEKLLAAVRAGVKTVLIPKENQKDLVKISDDVLGKVNVVALNSVSKAITECFVDNSLNNDALCHSDMVTPIVVASP